MAAEGQPGGGRETACRFAVYYIRVPCTMQSVCPRASFTPEAKKRAACRGSERTAVRRTTPHATGAGVAERETVVHLCQCTCSAHRIARSLARSHATHARPSSLPRAAELPPPRSFLRLSRDPRHAPAPHRGREPSPPRCARATPPSAKTDASRAKSRHGTGAWSPGLPHG